MIRDLEKYAVKGTMLKDFQKVLSGFTIQPKQIWAGVKGWPYFRKDLREIKRQLQGNSDFKITSLYPILRDRFASNGNLSHYFHEDLLAARRIFQNNPTKHVDVGSRVDGLVAHVASFREIEVFDIRPQEAAIKNICFVRADFMNISPSLYNYTDSLSCMNAIEHFGLGRYGDPIDVNGHLKGLESLYKVLKPGGKFYLSTPMGPQRIEFNAHRVFDLRYLLNFFEPRHVIDNFSYVDDQENLQENAALSDESVSKNFGCKFGFAIFEMTKK